MSSTVTAAANVLQNARVPNARKLSCIMHHASSLLIPRKTYCTYPAACDILLERWYRDGPVRVGAFTMYMKYSRGLVFLLGLARRVQGAWEFDRMLPPWFSITFKVAKDGRSSAVFVFGRAPDGPVQA